MKNHLIYYWWLYCLYAIAVIVIIMSFNNSINTPKENEIIRIAVAGEDMETSEFKDDILEYIRKNSSQEIKVVTVEYIDDENFDDALATRALGGYDLVILPSSYIKANTGSYFFLPLNDIVIDYDITSNHLFYEDSIPYGFLLLSEDIPSTFSLYLSDSDNEQYVAFINGYSVNVGPYNTYGSNSDTAVMTVIEFLIEGDR